MDEKPRCQLTGTDGNVFALAGRVARTLKQAGQQAQAEEMLKKLVTCASYDEALSLFMAYVDIA